MRIAALKSMSKFNTLLKEDYAKNMDPLNRVTSEASVKVILYLNLEKQLQLVQ